MKPVVCLALSLFALSFTRSIAAEDDRTFLVCEGVSQTDTSNPFAFTVTLDGSAGKILDIGTGPGATTESFTDAAIIGTQTVGNGVTNRLTIDRTTQAFTLEIIRAAKEGETAVENDDVFSGRCGPTARPF